MLSCDACMRAQAAYLCLTMPQGKTCVARSAAEVGSPQASPQRAARRRPRHPWRRSRSRSRRPLAVSSLASPRPAARTSCGSPCCTSRTTAHGIRPRADPASMLQASAWACAGAMQRRRTSVTVRPIPLKASCAQRVRGQVWQPRQRSTHCRVSLDVRFRGRPATTCCHLTLHAELCCPHCCCRGACSVGGTVNERSPSFHQASTKLDPQSRVGSCACDSPAQRFGAQRAWVKVHVSHAAQATSSRGCAFPQFLLHGERGPTRAEHCCFSAVQARRPCVLLWTSGWQDCWASRIGLVWCGSPLGGAFGCVAPQLAAEEAVLGGFWALLKDFVPFAPCDRRTLRVCGSPPEPWFRPLRVRL